MSRYPRQARNERLNCTSCDSPVVKSNSAYVCVGCGASPDE
ncbi:hypothetical protein [Halosimplex carlsbadense]|nr:hypothetical protein [Halosimplex carlsbadense]